MRDVSLGPTVLFGVQDSSACGRDANSSSASGELCLADDRFPGEVIDLLFHIQNL